MATAQGQAPVNRIEINPRYEWVPSQGFNTLLLHVAGFKKEDLKAQVDSVKRLSITGECSTEGNNRAFFRTTFILSVDTEITAIQAKFDKGILYVVVPKPPPVTTVPNQSGQGTSLNIINQEAARLCCKALLFVMVVVALFLFTKYKSSNQVTISSTQEL